MSHPIDTAILNSREKIAELDASNMLGSIEALADQVQHAWETTQNLTISFPEEIHQVVVSGMGGSALGPDVFKHLFAETLQIPFETYNGYDLPAYVGKNTLVILSSYSGTTEETLSCAEQAEKKGAQIAIITSGGNLKKLAEEKHYPAYIIDPIHNPSNQPRMAIGYAIVGLIGLLVKIGLVNLSQSDLDEVVTTIIRTAEKIQVDVPQEKNQAKLLAFSCIERRPIFVGSGFLTGALHVAANQWNENAKIFADYKIIPEINHHLMEGLQFPRTNPLHHVFLFINSELYRERIQKRMRLTQEVVEQNEIETIHIDLTSDTKLTQVFELITLMAYTGFYLSILEGLNPSPIPFVDAFKEALAKENV